MTSMQYFREKLSFYQEIDVDFIGTIIKNFSFNHGMNDVIELNHFDQLQPQRSLGQAELNTKFRDCRLIILT